MKIKRSQEEIVGMLMIVVIIAFLLLFAFKLILEYKQLENSDKENLASATVNSILRGSSDCTPDTDFQDLIIDCTKNSLGEESEIICSDGKDTCTYAHDKISSILSELLGERGIPYEFSVYIPSGAKIDNLSISSIKPEDMKNVRAGLTSVQSATQPLTIGGSFGNDFLEIKLCIGGEC